MVEEENLDNSNMQEKSVLKTNWHKVQWNYLLGTNNIFPKECFWRPIVGVCVIKTFFNIQYCLRRAVDIWICCLYNTSFRITIQNYIYYFTSAFNRTDSNTITITSETQSKRVGKILQFGIYFSKHLKEGDSKPPTDMKPQYHLEKRASKL